MKIIFCLLSTMLLSAPVAFAAKTVAKTTTTSDHQYNFRFGAISLLAGAINVNMDFAIAPEWTVGPELMYWHYKIDPDPIFTSKYDVTTSSLGIRANWFKNGNYTDGLYLGPSLRYVNIKLTTADSIGEVSGTASGLFAECLVGYGWFWSSFNQMLGAGFSSGVGTTKISVTDSSGRVTEVSSVFSGLALEYTLGWTF